MPSLEFIVPGKPVPYTRVTRMQLLSKHTTPQYKRYVIYKALTATCFLDQLLSTSKSEYTESQMQMDQTCTKEWRTHLIKLLGETINKTSTSMQKNYVNVRIKW